MELDIQKYYTELVDATINYIPKIFLALALYFIGRFIIKRLNRIISKWIQRSEIEQELSSFLESMIEVALHVLLIILIIPILGFELSAIVGMLAAVGFAIGMALQGFLGNFASGMTIIFLKPYRVGDWVQVSDYFGKVESIHIFNTILKTPGGKTLIIPNGKVTDDIITNYSTEGNIKLELEIPIGYEQNFPEIKVIILEALQGVDAIIHDPEPEIGIVEYDSHNIVVAVRPYIHPDQFWDATFLSNQAIKSALSTHGIEMSYSEGIENGPIGG